MFSPGKQLSLEFAVEQHLSSYRRAAERTRHVYFAILVVSVLAFGGYVNSRTSSWTSLRVAQARVALNNSFSLENREHAETLIARCRDGSLELLSCTDLENAWKMVQARGLQQERDVREHLGLLQQAQIQQVFNFSVPFFGLHFDVNDLGLLSSVTITLLSLSLLLSLAREHENLFLCMWLVSEFQQRLDEAQPPAVEGRVARRKSLDQASEANLVYHELAMAQLFSRPPTLARRWSQRLVRSMRGLFLLPLGVQLLLLFHDLSTMDYGMRLSREATLMSVVTQLLASAILMVVVYRCYRYAVAIAELWQKVFYKINPISACDKLTWRQYLRCVPWFDPEEKTKQDASPAPGAVSAN